MSPRSPLLGTLARVSLPICALGSAAACVGDGAPLDTARSAALPPGLVEDFVGTTSIAVDDAGTRLSGTVDPDWQVWFDGDTWGDSYQVQHDQSGSQTIAVTSGSFGIRRTVTDDSGAPMDIRGATLVVHHRADLNGWYEFMAGDVILRRFNGAAFSADLEWDRRCDEITIPANLPQEVSEVRFKVGSIDQEDERHEVEIFDVRVAHAANDQRCQVPALPFAEEFASPGTQEQGSVAQGSRDVDWDVWFDGTTWGDGYFLAHVPQLGAQRIGVLSGSFGLRRAFAPSVDLRGKWVTLRHSASLTGWYELLAGGQIFQHFNVPGAHDTVVQLDDECTQVQIPLSLPAAAHTLEIKVGSDVDHGSTTSPRPVHSVLLDSIRVDDFFDPSLCSETLLEETFGGGIGIILPPHEGPATGSRDPDWRAWYDDVLDTGAHWGTENRLDHNLAGSQTISLRTGSFGIVRDIDEIPDLRGKFINISHAADLNGWYEILGAEHQLIHKYNTAFHSPLSFVRCEHIQVPNFAQPVTQLRFKVGSRDFADRTHRVTLHEISISDAPDAGACF